MIEVSQSKKQVRQLNVAKGLTCILKRDLGGAPQHTPSMGQVRDTRADRCDPCPHGMGKRIVSPS